VSSHLLLRAFAVRANLTGELSPEFRARGAADE
jgi:hypothetical protein